MSAKFDAVIIGTGQSGPSSAARMIREGMKMAIIETEVLRRHMSECRLTDLLTEISISRAVDKQLWFVEARLQADD